METIFFPKSHSEMPGARHKLPKVEQKKLDVQKGQYTPLVYVSGVL